MTIMEPWIGENYHKRRILLLAESWYNTAQPNDVCTEINQHIKGLLQGSEARFFGKILNALHSGEGDVPVEARAHFWQMVAFDNFLPFSISSGPRVPPTAAQWQKGQKLFPSRRLRLKPRKIIVLGLRLREHVCPILGTSNEGIQWGAVGHPSSNQFKRRKLHDIFTSFQQSESQSAKKL
jgi:hypothetical protein